VSFKVRVFRSRDNSGIVGVQTVWKYIGNRYLMAGIDEEISSVLTLRLLNHILLTDHIAISCRA
jgi:hypothetical protein